MMSAHRPSGTAHANATEKCKSDDLGGKAIVIVICVVIFLAFVGRLIGGSL